MPEIEFVQPVQQPLGIFRLLDWLNANFDCADFHSFRCLAAFAKIQPFYKMHERIQAWRARGNTSEAIIGIDHKGTSYQALRYIMTHFTSTRILHTDGSTFHPKLYLFYGDKSAAAYYGSSNLTSGGLETNFEGGVLLRFQFPQDRDSFDALFQSYLSLLAPEVSCTKILTPDFLEELNQTGRLLDENAYAPPAAGAAAPEGPEAAAPAPLFSPVPVRPAQAVSQKTARAAAKSAGIVFNLSSTVRTPSGASAEKESAQSIPPASIDTSPASDVFVIQISPHHNGEIFLSKSAVKQNPSFFGYPFSGRTVPKRAGNPSYPQRIPDPVVAIRVYDASGAFVHLEENYPLNTVYYEKKSEIRITITPSILAGLSLVPGSTDYPILVMRKSSTPGYDYDMDFYAKGSEAYAHYLSGCNQSLPSGGKPVARKMGWL